MFWEIFYNLCIANGTKPNAVCKELNLSNATSTHWKNGAIPKGDILIKIADYFDCSVDYLLGRENYERKEAGIINTGNITNSKIVGGYDNVISENTTYMESEDNNTNNGIYFELIDYLEALSVSKRRHALADLMDILEEKYPI